MGIQGRNKVGNSIPSTHLKFLENAKARLEKDKRIIGLAIAGSYLSNQMDEFSDLDLKIIVEPADYDEVMNGRKEIASTLGDLVGAFTGEHVGEPRLLICLYDNPILHVDLIFMKTSDLHDRVENPVILFDRSDSIEDDVMKDTPSFPMPDMQWIEDRFWVWVHYMVTKIGRGELLEAIDHLSFLRSTVLGPLSLLETGEPPNGVRKVEFLAPARAEELKQTIPEYSVDSCFLCTERAIEMYKSLRTGIEYNQLILSHRAEQSSMQYLQEIKRRFAK